MAQNKFKKNQGKGKGSASTHNKLSEDMVHIMVKFRRTKSRMLSNSMTLKTQGL